MFARQIAVMKGQAWNVVETLKTPDHGPLELTRRAKVCVWDDLVDVPVAIPMRVTSAEMRRGSDGADYFGQGRKREENEEMDIGAASSSAPAPGHAVDLLGLGSPAELPHPGRFELTSTPSPGPPREGEVERPAPPRHSLSQPALPGSQAGRLNMYSPERERGGAAAREHQRRFSFATAAGRRGGRSMAQQLYRGDDGEEDDDGLEGDLGYAAAEGMEGNQRKVIVERLEPVKTRNPVFTWC